MGRPHSSVICSCLYAHFCLYSFSFIQGTFVTIKVISKDSLRTRLKSKPSGLPSFTSLWGGMIDRGCEACMLLLIL